MNKIEVLETVLPLYRCSEEVEIILNSTSLDNYLVFLVVCLIGWILETVNIGIDTWQFWAIMVMLTVLVISRARVMTERIILSRF